MEIQNEIDMILQATINKRASDIFFLPRSDSYQLIFRDKNGLNDLKKCTLSHGLELINYFKYAAQMDITEHRRPQVGALVHQYQNQEYFLRFSSLGNFDDKESLVIRIIYQLEQSNYFFRDQLELLKNLINRRGLIITSGPTGSGKTTTMYELAKISGQDKIVMTIEDPVEIHEQNFLQTQVNNEAEISYVSLLKAALRHRPDILIIGEIRDQETARLAVNAALSGHLVFATVHAKSTLQTISRLEGLNISKNELANCLTAVSYQRLLPTRDGLACLLDIAYGEILKQSLESKIHSDFVEWVTNLNILLDRKKITREVFAKFKQG